MSGCNSAILVASPKQTGLRGLIDPSETRISWRRSKREWRCGTFSGDGFDITASFAMKRSLKAFNPLLQHQVSPPSRGQGARRTARSTELQLKEAYDRCGELCAKDTNFFLATLLMTPEKQRALWALCVWCKRTDDLVDGPLASQLTPRALDQWETRLNDTFEGNPYDIYDVALHDTVSKFSIDIQHFRDLIKGMRMDTTKTRYKNFDELWIYCYYAAVTVGLICLPVMGIAPDSKATPQSIYNSVVACGVSNQLTNILRDVGEDARMGRIYLPLDELAAAGLSENDVFQGKVSDKWRTFIKSQIVRAKLLFDEAEKGIAHLDSASRWSIMGTSMIYRHILDAIEDNDYNNFTKRANVGKAKKLALLSIAYVRTFASSSSSKHV